MNTVVDALGALAHESRLSIFRLLVSRGPEGLPAGEIAAQLGCAPSSLSFHLKELHRAGLIQPEHRGRFIIYTASFVAMNELVDFLTENCCGGRPC